METVREVLSVWAGLIWARDSSAAEGLSLALVSLLGRVVQGFLLLGGHVVNEAHHPTAVAIIILITENELYNFDYVSNA